MKSLQDRKWRGSKCFGQDEGGGGEDEGWMSGQGWLVAIGKMQSNVKTRVLKSHVKRESWTRKFKGRKGEKC